MATKRKLEEFEVKECNLLSLSIIISLLQCYCQWSLWLVFDGQSLTLVGTYHSKPGLPLFLYVYS